MKPLGSVNTNVFSYNGKLMKGNMTFKLWKVTLIFFSFSFFIFIFIFLTHFLFSNREENQIPLL